MIITHDNDLAYWLLPRRRKLFTMKIVDSFLIQERRALYTITAVEYDSMIRTDLKVESCANCGKQIEYMMGSCRNCGTERPSDSKDTP